MKLWIIENTLSNHNFNQTWHKASDYVCSHIDYDTDFYLKFENRYADKKEKAIRSTDKKVPHPSIIYEAVRTCKKYIKLCTFEGARKVFVYWNYLYICLLLNVPIDMETSSFLTVNI